MTRMNVLRRLKFRHRRLATQGRGDRVRSRTSLFCGASDGVSNCSNVAQIKLPRPWLQNGGSARRPIFCRLRTFKKTEGEAHARRDAA